MRKIN